MIFIYNFLAQIATRYTHIFIHYLSLGGSSGLVTGVVLAKRAASAAASSFLRLSSSSLSCSRRFSSFNSNCIKQKRKLFIILYIIIWDTYLTAKNSRL